MNTLLQWFVTSSVLILVVLTLRRLLGGRLDDGAVQAVRTA